MIEWLELCESVKKRLNRNLNQEEIHFLEWIYHKHRTERIEHTRAKVKMK